MKNSIKNLVSAILFCCLLVVTIHFTSELLEDKSSREAFDTYIEICDDVDVEFLGASRVLWQVYPLNLWNDYGITAYNTALGGTHPQCWYWTMKETLNYHKPKLLVLDVSRFSRTEQADSEAMVNQVFDAFPLNMTKIEGAYDFKAENVADNIYDPINILFNIRKYHDRWTELTQNDFRSKMDNGFNTIRGQHIGTMDFDFTVIDKDKVTDDYTLSMYYVEECVKLALENGVEILLIQTPNPHFEEAQEVYNWCHVLADKYDIKYWNMTEDISYLNLAIDKSTNEHAGGEVHEKFGVLEPCIHLNVSGANKFNNVLAKYIIDNYGIEDHRGDEHYNYWNDYLAEWNLRKFKEMDDQETLEWYLVMLADEHFDVFIKVNSNMEFSDTERELFMNIGIDPDRIVEGALIFETKMGGEVFYSSQGADEKILEFNNLKYQNSDSTIKYFDNIYDMGIKSRGEIPPIQFFVVHDEDYSLSSYRYFY